MRLLGSDFLPTVTQYVDPSAIPAFLGGTLCTGPGGSDPECRDIVGPGGTIPLSLVVGVGVDGLGDGEELTVSKVATVLLRVPAGATLLWAWGCEGGHTIHFDVSAAPLRKDDELPREWG